MKVLTFLRRNNKDYFQSYPAFLTVYQVSVTYTGENNAILYFSTLGDDREEAVMNPDPSAILIR